MEYAYHRLARSSPQYRWWRQLVAAVIGVAIYLALSLIFGLALIVVLVLTSPDVSDPNVLIARLTELDLTDPYIFVLATGSIALMIPSVILARLIMGPRPIGLLSSVTGSLRWKWLLRCVPLAALPFAVVFGIQFIIPSGGAATAATVGASTLLLVVLALVLTPLQATAEEYVFRGFVMQAIGGWLRHPAWAILLPVPLFAIGHTQYGLLGLLDVSIFGLAAGYLTWRTGGLEAAIVAHVINNTTLFVLGAFALVDNGASEGSVLGILSTTVIMGAYTALVVWQAKRRGISTSRTVHPPEPPMERWAPPESSLGRTPGRNTDVPPVDQSPEGWPPPPPRPTPIERR